MGQSVDLVPEGDQGVRGRCVHAAKPPQIAPDVEPVGGDDATGSLKELDRAGEFAAGDRRRRGVGAEPCQPAQPQLPVAAQ